MSEILTFEQIKARYAPDWVLMGDIQTDEDASLVSGRVLFHGADRDEVYNKLADFAPDLYAVRCLRPWSEDMVFVL